MTTTTGVCTTPHVAPTEGSTGAATPAFRSRPDGTSQIASRIPVVNINTTIDARTTAKRSRSLILHVGGGRSNERRFRRNRPANGWLNTTHVRHCRVTDPDAAADDGTSASGPGPGGRDGRRFVLVLYVALVGVAATAGFLTGTFVEGLEAPRFLFLVPFPATPLGFAAYGGLTLALVLGVPLVFVVYVSRTIDDGG